MNYTLSVRFQADDENPLEELYFRDVLLAYPPPHDCNLRIDGEVVTGVFSVQLVVITLSPEGLSSWRVVLSPHNANRSEMAALGFRLHQSK